MTSREINRRIATGLMSFELGPHGHIVNHTTLMMMLSPPLRRLVQSYDHLIR